MDLSQPSHKKTLGILFIVFSILGLFGLWFYDIFMDFIFGITEANGDPVPKEAIWFFDLIESILWAIAILFYIPRIVIGFGLVNGRKWAMMPALIYGIIGIINFPVGTLVGVYAILIYGAKDKNTEDLQ